MLDHGASVIQNHHYQKKSVIQNYHYQKKYDRKKAAESFRLTMHSIFRSKTSVLIRYDLRSETRKSHHFASCQNFSYFLFPFFIRKFLRFMGEI